MNYLLPAIDGVLMNYIFVFSSRRGIGEILALSSRWVLMNYLLSAIDYRGIDELVINNIWGIDEPTHQQ